MGKKIDPTFTCLVDSFPSAAAAWELRKTMARGGGDVGEGGLERSRRKVGAMALEEAGRGGGSGSGRGSWGSARRSPPSTCRRLSSRARSVPSGPGPAGCLGIESVPDCPQRPRLLWMVRWSSCGPGLRATCAQALHPGDNAPYPNAEGGL